MLRALFGTIGGRTGTLNRISSLTKRTFTKETETPTSSIFQNSTHENLNESKYTEGLSNKVSELTEITSKLMLENEDIKKKYLLALADGENARKRFMIQIENGKQFAIRSFCKELLPIIDTLKIAIETEKNDSNLQGLLVIQKQVVQCLDRNGLVKQQVEIGQVFDPNLHEALFQKPIQNDAEKPNTICCIEKPGYMFKSHVLRAAVVGVYK